MIRVWGIDWLGGLRGIDSGSGANILGRPLRFCPFFSTCAGGIAAGFRCRS